MNKETKPKILIVGSDSLARKAAVAITLRAGMEVVVDDSVYDVEPMGKVENLSIRPVSAPSTLKLRDERKDNHWRGGKRKKGGKVGYERR